MNDNNNVLFLYVIPANFRHNIRQYEFTFYQVE